MWLSSDAGAMEYYEVPQQSARLESLYASVQRAVARLIYASVMLFSTTNFTFAPFKFVPV